MLPSLIARAAIDICDAHGQRDHKDGVEWGRYKMRQVNAVFPHRKFILVINCKKLSASGTTNNKIYAAN